MEYVDIDVSLDVIVKFADLELKGAQVLGIQNLEEDDRKDGVCKLHINDSRACAGFIANDRDHESAAKFANSYYSVENQCVSEEVSNQPGSSLADVTCDATKVDFFELIEWVRHEDVMKQ